MEKKKLKLGKMTNKELAEWFGVKEGSFKNRKKKRLEELKFFADFEEYKGKIIVTKIKHPYHLKTRDISDEEFEKKFLKAWHKNLDTCARVAEVISEDYNAKGYCITPGSVRNRVYAAREKYFGNPATGKPGLLGTCSYWWAVRDAKDPLAPSEFFKREEYEIYKELKMFLKTPEERIKHLDFLIKEGELIKTEAWDKLIEFTNADKATDPQEKNKFLELLFAFKACTGKILVRGTLVDFL